MHMFGETLRLTMAIARVRRMSYVTLTAGWLILLTMGPAARADSIAWENPASGIWSAGANWAGGLVPGMDDTAVISVQDVNEPDYTVTLDINTTVSGLNVSTLTGGLDISGVTFNVTNAAQVTTGPVRAINSNTTFGSLVNATDLTLFADDGNNTFTVDGSASNSNEILLRTQKQASSSFFSTIANFNSGLLNQGTLAFQPNVLTSGTSQGQVNVTGTLTNEGAIVYRAGVGAGVFGINADVLNNSGTISSEDPTEILGFGRANAAYTNSGVISSRMNVLQAGSFDNTSTGQITGSFVTIDGNGAGTMFTNDGTINLGNGSTTLNVESFETGINRGTISANTVNITTYGAASFTNEGSIHSASSTVIQAGMFMPKAGSLTGGGSLTLNTDIEMDGGFSPGFNNIVIGPAAGSTNTQITGTGTLNAPGSITMLDWVQFNNGTSLDFDGDAIFRATNKISSSNRLTLPSALMIDAGDRFRVQAINGFSGANLGGHVTNNGEFWVETTRQFNSASFQSLSVNFSSGLTNNGLFVGRPKSGAGVIVRNIDFRGSIDNHGTIINNDANDLNFRGGIDNLGVNNTGLVEAAAGNIVFSFVPTFNNTGEVHIAAGRSVTMATNTSSFVNQVDGVISGNGTLDAQGSFTDHGTITPGTSPGTLTINAANYTQATDGVIELEVMGYTPGTQHDQLIINAPTAVFNGTLRLVFLEEFAPQQDDVFEFIVGAADYNFEQVELVNLGSDFEYDLGFADGSLNLTALNDAEFVIPEPATFMLAVSLMALGRKRRRV